MDQAENLRNIMEKQKQNQNHISQARVIAVTSGKGGVGKSNVAINLAMQFTKLGKKVIIIDADFGLANVEVMFGVIPKYNLSDLIYNGKELKEIISTGPEGVGFVSGGSGIANLANMDDEKIRRLISKLSELEEMADIVIIDTGAGISPGVMGFLVSSPETILVTTPEPTSITDSYALLKMLSMHEDFDASQNKILMLANRVASDAEGRNLFEKLSMVVSQFLQLDIGFLGIVPYDHNITRAVMKQKPISLAYPDSPAAKRFETIAKKLDTNDNSEGLQTKGLRGYLKAVFAKKR